MEREKFESLLTPPTGEELKKRRKDYCESLRTIKPHGKKPWSNLTYESAKPFKRFNEDWAINEDGDLLGWGYYFIDCNRLNKGDWLIHLMEKKMFDANTFIPAFREACWIAGVYDATFKLFY